MDKITLSGNWDLIASGPGIITIRSAVAFDYITVTAGTLPSEITGASSHGSDDILSIETVTGQVVYIRGAMGASAFIFADHPAARTQVQIPPAPQDWNWDVRPAAGSGNEIVVNRVENTTPAVMSIEYTVDGGETANELTGLVGTHAVPEQKGLDWAYQIRNISGGGQSPWSSAKTPIYGGPVLGLAVVPDPVTTGGAFTITVTVPAGGTLSTVTATANGTPVALTGSGNTRTGTAPAEAGPLVVTATGADAEGNPLNANRTVQVREEPVAPTAPGQFTSSDWSVTTGLAASQVVLNVSALPSDGGSTITALQYTVDGGSTWIALTGTGTGARTLTMPAAGTAYTFALRAVNAVGAGAASATKSATSGAPSATELVWGISPGASERQVAITLSEVPDGTTSIEYTYDGGRSHSTLPGGVVLGTKTVTMSLPGLGYDFQLRPVIGDVPAEWSDAQGVRSRPRTSPPAISALSDVSAADAIVVIGASHALGAFGGSGQLSSLTTFWQSMGFTQPIYSYAVGGTEASNGPARVDTALANATISAFGKIFWLIDYGGNDAVNYVSSGLTTDFSPKLAALTALRDHIASLRPDDPMLFLAQSKRYSPWADLTEDADLETLGMRAVNEQHFHALFASLSKPAGAWFDTDGLPFVTSYLHGELNPNRVGPDGNHYGTNSEGVQGNSYGQAILVQLADRINGVRRKTASRAGEAYLTWLYGTSGTPTTAGNVIRPSVVNINCGMQRIGGGGDRCVGVTVSATNSLTTAALTNLETIKARIPDTRFYDDDRLLAAGWGVTPGNGGDITVFGLTPGDTVQIKIAGTSRRTGSRKSLNTLHGLGLTPQTLEHDPLSTTLAQITFEPVVVPADGMVKIYHDATAESTDSAIQAILIDVLA